MSFALSRKVIGCAMGVHSTLGCGFLERVYANALAIEFEQSSISFKREAGCHVHYRGHIVGEYFSDFTVGKTCCLKSRHKDL